MAQSTQPFVERRRPHRRQRFLVLIAIVASVCFVGVGVVSMPAPKAPNDDSRPSALPAGHDLLVSALDQRRRSLLPADREQLLAKLAANVPQLLPPLLWVLGQPGHARFSETAQLAADLQVTEAVEPLVIAAWDTNGRHRSPALAALDRLQPLDEHELLELLRHEDIALTRTGLRLLAARAELSTALLAALLDLLRHPDVCVRGEALQRFPAELPDALVDELLRQLDDPLVGPFALRLLTRVTPTRASTTAIARRLANAEPADQLALLPTIDRYATNEPVRKVLWELATGSGPLELRAAALHSLERVRADQPLPLDAASWPPLIKLHAARLRVQTGHLDGINTLLDLVATEDEESRAVRGQARLVLARLANLPPHANLQDLLDWGARLEEVPLVDLPAPGRCTELVPPTTATR